MNLNVVCGIVVVLSLLKKKTFKTRQPDMTPDRARSQSATPSQEQPAQQQRATPQPAQQQPVQQQRATPQVAPQQLAQQQAQQQQRATPTAQHEGQPPATFTQSQVLSASLRVRRLFVGLPFSAVDDALLRAGTSVARMAAKPAPQDVEEAAVVLGILFLQDTALATDIAQTYVDLARGACNAPAPRKRQREEDDAHDVGLPDAASLQQIFVAAEDARADKGRTRYHHLAAHVRVPSDPLTSTFLYPHLWVAKGGADPQLQADRWTAEALQYINPALFASETVRARARKSIDEVRAWIRTAADPLSRDVFRFGWNRFVEVAELYALILKKNTSCFGQKVLEKLNDTGKVFVWEAVFDSLPAFRPFRNAGGAKQGQGQGHSGGRK